MAEPTFDKLRGDNFTAAHIGKWANLDRYSFRHPKLPRPYPGKLFLKKELKLTGMEVSLNKLPPGTQMSFYHKHQENEELYLFIKGTGSSKLTVRSLTFTKGQQSELLLRV